MHGARVGSYAALALALMPASRLSVRLVSGHGAMTLPRCARLAPHVYMLSGELPPRRAAGPRGFHPCSNRTRVVQNGTAGDNDTAGGTLSQPVLDFLVLEYSSTAVG